MNPNLYNLSMTRMKFGWNQVEIYYLFLYLKNLFLKKFFISSNHFNFTCQKWILLWIVIEYSRIGMWLKYARRQASIKHLCPISRPLRKHPCSPLSFFHSWLVTRGEEKHLRTFLFLKPEDKEKNQEIAHNQWIWTRPGK